MTLDEKYKIRKRLLMKKKKKKKKKVTNIYKHEIGRYSRLKRRPFSILIRLNWWNAKI